MYMRFWGLYQHANMHAYPHTESIRRVSHVYVYPMCICIVCHHTESIPCVCVSHVYSHYVSSYREYPTYACIPCVFVLCVIIQRVPHVYMYPMCIRIVCHHTESIPCVCVSHVYLCPTCIRIVLSYQHTNMHAYTRAHTLTSTDTDWYGRRQVWT